MNIVKIKLTCFLLFISVFTLSWLPSAVYSHNIPTVVHSITLEYTERGALFLLNYRYDPIIVHRFLPSIDRDNNHEISIEEKTALAQQYVDNLKVTINDTAQILTITSVEMPQYSELLVVNEGLTIKGTIGDELSCDDTTKFTVTDSNIFLSLQDDIYNFTHVNKDCFSVSQISASGDTSTAAIGTAASGTVLGSSNDTSWFNFTRQMSIENIQSIIKDPQQGFLVFGIGMVLAVVIGGLHALTPGHGKTLVAAYLVGQHGTVRDALFLGLVTTLTHTLSIYALGFLSLFATKYFLPEKIIPALEAISAVSILAIGLWLLVQRYKEYKKTRRHPIMQTEEHEHHHAITHSHGGVEHTHDLSELKGKKLTLPSLLSLGFSGGIVPCTDALAIMILAISLQQIVLGMILIFFFSVGLAGVLIGIGVVLVTSKSFFERFDRNNAISRYAPLMSAVIITLLGVLLLWRSLTI